MLDEARKEGRFTYDTSKYDFEGHFKRMFTPLDGPLSSIHALPKPESPAPISLALMHGYKVAGVKMPAAWNKALRYKKDRLKKFIGTPAFKDFKASFDVFVRDEIAPLIGDPQGLAYQSPPTMRVQLPSKNPMGVPHKDSDYERHVEEEVNIWVPVTDTFGTNTLHTESEPGRGDFHPLECRYGEAVRFWGNQCWHYTVPNSTEATRVSFDFRVIPMSRYDVGRFEGLIGDYPCAFTGPLRGGGGGSGGEGGTNS